MLRRRPCEASFLRLDRDPSTRSRIAPPRIPPNWAPLQHDGQRSAAPRIRRECHRRGAPGRRSGRRVILADTSAWVEYDRATGSAVDQRLTELIRDDGPLAVTEPVLMEVMAGARDGERERALRRLLLRFDLLAFDTAADFDA